MLTLPQQVQQFIERENLFTHDDRLLLACSGGLDSTVLAHVLHELGYKFAIAHMNYQLRGADSDGDAAFVEELAGTLGAKFWYKAVEVKREAEAGESTQMTCRRLRYDWFFDCMWSSVEDFCELYVTAHHLDDNFETVLMNILRGTGIQGITGMEPKRVYKGFFARPLLEVSRQQLEEYAKEKGIEWREDASNATDDYKRNEVRHHLTPVFRERFGLSDDNLRQTIKNLRNAHLMHSRGLSAMAKKFCKEINGYLLVDRSGFSSKEELHHFLHHMVNDWYRPGNRFGKYTNEQFRQAVTVPGNRIIEGDFGHIRITPDTLAFRHAAHSKLEPLAPITITSLDSFGAFPTPDSIRMYLSLDPRPESLEVRNTLHLAPPSFPLHLRPRKNGDRFRPFGMKSGTKKVKDYFIDQKVPVWLRDRIYLLTDDEDNILAIPGYTIDDRYRVREGDEVVLRITTR